MGTRSNNYRSMQKVRAAVNYRFNVTSPRRPISNWEIEGIFQRCRFDRKRREIRKTYLFSKGFNDEYKAGRFCSKRNERITRRSSEGADDRNKNKRWGEGWSFRRPRLETKMIKFFLVMDYIDGNPRYSKTEIIAQSLKEALFIIKINKLKCIDIHKEITR